MKKNNSFHDRKERSQWIVKKFQDKFYREESVLDIGCYKKDIKRYLPKGIKYKGIDIEGEPDIILDLDKSVKLPIKDKEYDIIVCADVLEHLENIHEVFDEICRVTRKHIIITLPIPTSIFWRYLLNRYYSNNFEKSKSHGLFSKYYGLPLEKPVDRHRWFYNNKEAERFIKYRSEKNGFSVSYIELLDLKPNIFIKIILSLIGNLKGGTIVALITR